MVFEMVKEIEPMVRARMIMGRATEMKLYEYLKRHEGQSIYGISKDLGWSTGKVQRALERISDDIKNEIIVENGRVKRRIYLKEIEDFLDMSKF